MLFATSLVLWPRLTSHGKSCFNHAYEIHQIAMSVRPPQVRTHSFSPRVCHIYYVMFRIAIGLQFVRQPNPST